MSPVETIDQAERMREVDQGFAEAREQLDAEIPMIPVHGTDHLAGMYFWWDAAPPPKQAFYVGRVAASLDGGYYLLAFAKVDTLPVGLHEIVHVSTMVGDNWSFYRSEHDIKLAISRKADESA